MDKITDKQATTLLEHAKFIKANNTKMRLGQALSKLISLQYPSIHKQIIATEYDPFYSDDIIEKCLTKITK